MTTLSTSCTSDTPYEYMCEVANTGSLEGDEVVQVYHSVSDAIRAKVGCMHVLTTF